MANAEKGAPPAYEEPAPESIQNAVSGQSTDAVAQAVAAIAANAADGPAAASSSEPGAAASLSAMSRLSILESLDDEQHAAPLAEMDVPPPPYSHELGHIQDQSGMGTKARMADDGRVNIRIRQDSKRLSRILEPALREQLHHIQEQGPPPPPYIPEALGGPKGAPLPPSMNIVIMVVGSRGDVQPFVALGKVLKESYKHRVRLATHPTFKSFVEENGLEFFSIGGDPAELMAFMVKNPGLMPAFETFRRGDIGKRRIGIGKIIKGCWRACFETGDGMGSSQNDMTPRNTQGQDIQEAYLRAGAGKPFIADAIIANPPSFAHVHCAERLGIPLHMMFTMPWSPTQSFPHPLANIQSSDADASFSNLISYALVDMLTWQGLGDVINRFRVHSLHLEPISLMWAPCMLARLRVPFTYCWSLALIPKPKDWGPNICVSGFYFLNLASNYTPAADLKAYLDDGPPPVYIGFGSIVVDDPNKLTEKIFDAVKKAGVRAIVSKGWGGIGADELDIPEGVFMLGNCPHDWLFRRVSAVVHHGGAGTTAAGIAAGRPTVIIPFFGDQLFWGAMVAKAGAGPNPIPQKNLTADNLAEAIKFALEPTSQERAEAMAAAISKETGNQTGAESFHQLLPGGVDKLRCHLIPSHAAVWHVKKTEICLSPLAACILAEEKILSFNDLELFRSCEYETDEGPWDPISGSAGALIGTLSSVMLGVADLPVEMLKALRIHPDASKSKNKAAKDVTHAGPSSSKGTLSPAYSSTGMSGVASPMASTSSLPAMAAMAGLGAGMLSLERMTSGSTLSADGTPDSTDLGSPPIYTSTSGSTSIKRKPVPSGAVSTTASMSEASTIFTEPTPLGSPPSSSTENLPPPKIEKSDRRSDSNGVFRRSRPESESSTGHASRGNPLAKSRATSSVHDFLEAGMAGSRQASLDTMLGTGKGLQKIVGAGLKSPMDLTLALAKGFRNVPKLYGDDTVRKVDKVTDLQSGLMTATKEFGFGIYDGITGLVTQPIRGAKQSGVGGFVKGAGKGLAGAIVKPSAGVNALPGFALKGIYQEIQKRCGSNVDNYIIASRIAQGYAELGYATRKLRTEVATRYLELKSQPQGEKRWWHREKEHESEKSVKANDKMGAGGSSQTEDSEQRESELGNRQRSSSVMSSNADTTLAQSMTAPLPPHSELEVLPCAELEASAPIGRPGVVSDEHDELEEAIRLSIQQTSRGNDGEDTLIANAIRASLTALEEQAQKNAADDDEALQRAIAASVAEAARHAPAGVDEEAYQDMLEQVLRQSVLEQQAMPHAQAGAEMGGAESSDNEWDDSSDEFADSDHGVDFGKAAVAVAERELDEDKDEDEELRRAMQESMDAAEKEKVEEAMRAREEVVLKYVQKQSLMEEEARRKANGQLTDGKDMDEISREAGGLLRP